MISTGIEHPASKYKGKLKPPAPTRQRSTPSAAAM
jgi:hypothetical protein